MTSTRIFPKLVAPVGLDKPLRETINAGNVLQRSRIALLTGALMIAACSHQSDASLESALTSGEYSCEQSTITFRQQTLRRLSGEEIEKFIVGRGWTYDQGEDSLVYVDYLRVIYRSDGTFREQGDFFSTTSGQWRIAGSRLCEKYAHEAFERCRCFFVSEVEEYFLMSDFEGDVQVPLKLEFLDK